MQTVAAELRDSRHYRAMRAGEQDEPTEREILMREIEGDAEAIARIVNSPRVPDEVKQQFSQNVLTFTDDYNEAPEVIREQWTIAALKFCAEQK